MAVGPYFHIGPILLNTRGFHVSISLMGRMGLSSVKMELDLP